MVEEDSGTEVQRTGHPRSKSEVVRGQWLAQVPTNQQESETDYCSLGDLMETVNLGMEPIPVDHHLFK
jgi:hypothetical protein